MAAWINAVKRHAFLMFRFIKALTAWLEGIQQKSHELTGGLSIGQSLSNLTSKQATGGFCLDGRSKQVFHFEVIFQDCSKLHLHFFFFFF